MNTHTLPRSGWGVGCRQRAKCESSHLIKTKAQHTNQIIQNVNPEDGPKLGTIMSATPLYKLPIRKPETICGRGEVQFE